MTSWSAGGGGPRTPSHAHIERRQHQHDETWLQVDGGDDAGASYVTAAAQTCTRCGTSANLNAAELQRTAILSLKAAIDRLGDLPNRELIVRMPSTYVA